MDAGAIARVHVRSWQAGYRGQLPDELLDSLNATDRVARWEAEIEAAEWPGRGTLLIEDHDARVAGFAHLVPSRDGDDGPDSTGEIASFYIDPTSWGQGLGSRLMHSALAELGSAYRTGTLWVLETNNPGPGLLRGHRLGSRRPRQGRPDGRSHDSSLALSARATSTLPRPSSPASAALRRHLRHPPQGSHF
ncbi:GNAT family N-acetyltransferase [Pseudonocardia sp. NPDC046786]|uniref:GNAT family N-acetyltransferase n=1 Tax=Pseudonocardia sp. NPDC046786 TaxID=3155471 RepID=UPI0033E71CAC